MFVIIMAKAWKSKTTTCVCVCVCERKTRIFAKYWNLFAFRICPIWSILLYIEKVVWKRRKIRRSTRRHSVDLLFYFFWFFKHQILFTIHSVELEHWFYSDPSLLLLLKQNFICDYIQCMCVCMCVFISLLNVSLFLFWIELFKHKFWRQKLSSLLFLMFFVQYKYISFYFFLYRENHSIVMNVDRQWNSITKFESYRLWWETVLPF